MTKLYHRDLGIPASALNCFDGKVFELFYTEHARRALLNDRYGRPKSMPTKVTVRKADVVEVAVRESGHVEKIVVRVSACPGFIGPNPDMDLCLALAPADFLSNVLRVKTCWFNHKDDTHATLDASKYTRP